MPNLLVFLQFILMAVCFYPWPEPYQINWGAGLIVLSGILGMITLVFNGPGNFNIRPVYKKGGELILNGSYGYFRHPMYVAVLLAVIGAVVMQQQLLKLLAVFLLWIVFEAKARLEEKAMVKQFPEYSAYMAASFRWLPFNYRRGEK